MYDLKSCKAWHIYGKDIVYLFAGLEDRPKPKVEPSGGHAPLKLKKLEWDADEREKKRKKNKTNKHKFLSKVSRGL